MKDLLESVRNVLSETNDFVLVEEYFVENIDEISDIVMDNIEENNIDVDSLSEEELNTYIDAAIVQSSGSLDEGLLKTIINRVGGLFGGAKPIPHSNLATGLSPSPKRLSNQLPSPAVQQAKAQVVKRIQHGSRARKSVLAALTPEQRQVGLGDGMRMVSRTRKGVVLHYKVPVGEKFSAKKHKSFMKSTVNSSGTYDHEKFDD